MKNCNNHACGGAVYGMGFVGALVYYLQHATTFSQVAFGLFRAMLWPGFLIYKIFTLLKM